MNAIVEIGGSRAWFDYICPECGRGLHSDAYYIKHPTHVGVFFKGKQINCLWAGKTFKRPVQTILLEEVQLR